MRPVILYIPGLGDGYDRFRRLSLGMWRLFGVDARLVPITWYDGGDFDAKYALVETAIRNVRAQNRPVVLVGESAGATLVLHAAARHPDLKRVVTLCGVATPTTPIAARLRRKAPALDTAVTTLPAQFAAPVVSLRAAVDHVVGSRYSSAAGAETQVVWSVGHLLTISLCLTVYSPYLVRLCSRP